MPCKKKQCRFRTTFNNFEEERCGFIGRKISPIVPGNQTYCFRWRRYCVPRLCVREKQFERCKFVYKILQICCVLWCVLRLHKTHKCTLQFVRPKAARGSGNRK